MINLETFLAGGDLRSIGKSNLVIAKIENQNDFDDLFRLLFHNDRIIVMRAADAIEKITISNSKYLAKYKKNIIDLCYVAKDKELKWHLALLIPRLKLVNGEFDKGWNILLKWAKDSTDSRIVRVNSIEALSQMAKHNNKYEKDLSLILSELRKENIPSINARIRRIQRRI